MVFFMITVIYVFTRYGIKISRVWISNILKYGFPLLGTGIAVWVLTSTDRYFLAHFSDLSSVGIYAVGMKLANFLGMIAGALQLAWGPFAANIQYEENAKMVYKRVFLLYFIINVIAVFLISMFAIDFLKIFTQPAYYPAKIVVPFLCFATIFNSGFFIVAIGISLTKKVQHTIWITILAALVNIISNFLLTPTYGVIGASFSLLMAFLAMFILTLIMSQKYYFIPYNYLRIVYLLLPSIIIIAISYYFDYRLYTRIILSVTYLIFAVSYLYLSYKNSPELIKAYEKIKNLKSLNKVSQI